MTVHQRRAARARYVAAETVARGVGVGISASFASAQSAAINDAVAWVAGPPDLHARRASQELQRMWLRAVHKAIRKARRFRGVHWRYAQAPKGREIAQGWYVE